MTETPGGRATDIEPAPRIRRPEADTPPETANEYSPDGWDANHAVLARLGEHRVAWKP